MNSSQFEGRLGRLYQTSATIVAYMELCRLPQTIVVVLGTLIGAGLAGVNATVELLLTVSLSNVCLFMGAMAFNDSRDVAEDTVNKPRRPVPSGRISAQHALWFAIACFAAGIAFAATVNVLLAVAAAMICLLSAAYTLALKRIPFLGNILVSAVSVYPLYCWIIGQLPLGQAFFFVVAAGFLIRVGAELIKTAEDCVGDDKAGIQTAATVCGTAFAYRFGSLLMCSGLVVLWSAPDLFRVVKVGLVVSSALAALAIVLSFRAASREQGHQMVLIERAIISIVASVLAAQVVFPQLAH